ncbi:hypothetical protein LCGC14_1727710, partial [marine sediment metagenome]
MSEAIPIGRVFERFNKASGGSLERVLREGAIGATEEALQEFFQTTAGNLIAQKIYDKERKLVDGLAGATGAGGILGGFASAIAAALGVRVRGRRIEPQQPVEPPEIAPEPLAPPEGPIAPPEAPQAIAGPLTKESLLTPAGAGEFVARHPEAAQALANVEGKVSRRQEFGDVIKAEPDVGNAWNSKERETVRNLVKEEIENARQAQVRQGIEDGQGLQEGQDVEGLQEGLQDAEEVQQEVEKSLADLERPIADASKRQQPPPPPDAIDKALPKSGEEPDIPKLIDTWGADRDESSEEAKGLASTREKEMVALAGVKRAGSKKHRAVSLKMQVHIDLRNAEERGFGTPAEQIAKYADKLSDEQLQTLEASQNLAPAEMEMVERFIEENRQLGVEALGAEVIGNYYENYTARILKPPVEKSKGLSRAAMAKFTLTTARARQRKLESIPHAWSLGYELVVPDVTTAQRIARESVAQVIHDRNFRDAAFEAGIFSTTQRDGDAAIEHPNMKKWESSGEIKFDANAEPEVGDWVRPTDRGNLGKIVEINGNEFSVRFRNKAEGTEATVAFPVEELKGRVVAPRGKNFFITDDGKIMERREVYAPKKIATHLNNALGSHTENWLRGIAKWNSILKHTILTTSLYHHGAFLNSYLFAGKIPAHKVIAEILRGIYGAGAYVAKGDVLTLPARAINPFGLMRGGVRQMKGFRAGQAAIESFGPMLRELARGGLTTGRQQDWDVAALQQKTLIGKMIDKVPGAKEAKDFLLELRDAETNFLFNELGPNLKVMVALLEYKHSLQKYSKKLMNGTVERHKLATDVALAVNADFGGLNLFREGRDPNKQFWFRMFALAPDWTESNVRSAVKAFKLGEEGRVYRAFWARIAAKGLLAIVFFNYLMSL